MEINITWETFQGKTTSDISSSERSGGDGGGGGGGGALIQNGRLGVSR